jgi:hypothetical protein
VGTTSSLADLVIDRLGLTPGGRFAGFAAELPLSFASSAVAAAREEYGSSSAVGVDGGTSGTGAFSGTARSEVSLVIKLLLGSPSMVFANYEALRARTEIQTRLVNVRAEMKKTLP